MKLNPKALTFDVFGTTVDWRTPIIREGDHLTRLGKAPGIDWPRFADTWRAGYAPAMDRVRWGDLPWTSLDRLHRIILNHLLEQFHIHGLTEAEIENLNSVWHRLDAWPDAVAGLNRLRQRFIVAALSNGNMSLLINLSKHAGLTWDGILSAEFARHYKPDEEVYQMAASLLSLEPGDILMVAAHTIDLLGARAVGFRTAYVERPEEHGGPYRSAEPAVDFKFDIYARDFLDLAEQLESE